MLMPIIFTFFLSQCYTHKERLIIGGKNVTDIGQFPHSLFILFTCPGVTGTWICGGSILTQNVFLTAGHCINERCKMKMQAIAGSEDIYKEKSIIRYITKHYRHKYFDETGASFRNDIALLAVKLPLPLGRNVKRIVIHSGFPDKTVMATVAGWGRISDSSDELPKNLKFVWQFVKTTTFCQKHLGEPLWPGQLCADNNVKNRPTIYDSGCALMTKTGQQLGLVSYRTPQKPEVVVYTNVSHFYPWIKENTRLLYCQVEKLPNDTKVDYYGEDPNVRPEDELL